MTDFDIYVRWFRHGSRIKLFLVPLPDKGKYNARKAFKIIDGSGNKVETKHPRLLQAALTGKAQLNWQIKQWAEGIAEGLFLPIEFQEEYKWLPEWVWKALKSQVYKLIILHRTCQVSCSLWEKANEQFSWNGENED